ncbi:MAG: GAF domain-containing protein [Gammaproteobacteria bacterium]
MSHESARYEFRDKAGDYASVARELESLLAGEHDLIANAANATSLIYHALPDLNWCGVYLLRGKELIVGPFQGKPACVHIPLGKGVCGTAAAERKTIVVTDVHAFPGHIACDAASRSEIVIPLFGQSARTDGAYLLGVLDLDSPKLARFDEEDRRGLEALAAVFMKSLSA